MRKPFGGREQEQLVRLAEQFGVQRHYVDVKGERQEASADDLRETLRAMGVPSTSLRDVRDAFRDRSLRNWRRPLNPVTVCWEGEMGFAELRLPDSARWTFGLQLESGERLACPRVSSGRTKTVEGETRVVRRISCGRELPVGYHTLIAENGSERHEGALFVAPQRCFSFDDARHWGIFAPVYALRSERNWGAGDLADLSALDRCMRELGGDFVGTLPMLASFLDEPFEPSPYAPVSRLFWNEMYVDVEALPELAQSAEARELIASTDLRRSIGELRAADRVDYRQVMALKRAALQLLADTFFDRAPDDRRAAYGDYFASNSDLAGYASFRAAKEGRDGDPNAVNYHLYAQWIMHEQMSHVAAHARSNGPGLYLDYPLGAHPDGYDVAANPGLFAVGTSAGAPPDALFTKGQSWGLPPMRPDAMREERFAHVIKTLRHHLRYAGMLRIDHVMGFHRLFWVPVGAEPARGVYVRYPEEELFAILAIESQRHRSVIVGEDLGTVPDEVRALMAARGVKRMFVLQYELSPALPAPEPPREALASLNTHDMPTFASYWNANDIDSRVEMGLLEPVVADMERADRGRIRESLSGAFADRDLPDDPLDGSLLFLAGSDAEMMLVNLEDLWREERPQNVPGTTAAERPNWQRKLNYDVQTAFGLPEVRERLQGVNERLRRCMMPRKKNEPEKPKKRRATEKAKAAAREEPPKSYGDELAPAQVVERRKSPVESRVAPREARARSSKAPAIASEAPSPASKAPAIASEATSPASKAPVILSEAKDPRQKSDVSLSRDHIGKASVILSEAKNPPRKGRVPISADPQMGDWDIHLFNEGTHQRLFDKLGAHLVTRNARAGVQFTVWAPAASEVSVIGDFNGWAPGANRLEALASSGLWTGFIPGIEKGANYKYHIVSHLNGYTVAKTDPFGLFNEVPPQTASRVWDLEYQWNDDEWIAGRAERNSLYAPIAIYEAHLGSWRRKPEDGYRSLSYRELAEELPQYLREMGFTHVEFLPVMEHPFFGSWGYQTTGYFAPTSRFGTPQDFMYLVDALHQHGIGVILDWVPSHFPTDEHGLGYFDGTHLFEHADPRQGFHPDWKSSIFNYGRNEVRAFLVSSAIFWLEKYHVDALRVDAVASMLYLDYSRKAGEWIPNRYGGRDNIEALEFLRQLNAAVYESFPGVQTIAEESTAWPMVSRPTYVGGLGFGMKWDMGWMHDTLKYMSHDPVFRRFHHNELTFRGIYAFTENFVLPLSHDEVVHGKGSLLGKMPGDEWQKFANLRLLYSYMYATPGKKLMFMGGEFAQGREWNHDAGLEWDLLRFPFHAGVQSLIRDLNRIYRENPSLCELDADPAGFEWLDANDSEQSVLSFIRHAKEGDHPVMAVFNFTPVVRHNYSVGARLGGWWSELFNSDAEEYGGSGQGNLGGVEAAPIPYHGRRYSLNVTLPPLGAVFFKAEEETPAE